mgnify:CR=1 FL=1
MACKKIGQLEISTFPKTQTPTPSCRTLVLAEMTYRHPRQLSKSSSIHPKTSTRHLVKTCRSMLGSSF